MCAAWTPPSVILRTSQHQNSASWMVNLCEGTEQRRNSFLTALCAKNFWRNDLRRDVVVFPGALFFIYTTKKRTHLHGEKQCAMKVKTPPGRGARSYFHTPRYRHSTYRTKIPRKTKQFLGYMRKLKERYHNILIYRNSNLLV